MKMTASLESVFLIEASSLVDEIDSVQLQRLLVNKDGKNFDQQLCDELVDHYGNGGFINLDGFDHIWTNLQKRRTQFEHLAQGRSVLTKEAFRKFLESAASQRIPSSFMKEIMRFYKNRISFDVVVHAVHHIRKIADRVEFSHNENLMDTFLISVFTKVPTAPSANDINSFSSKYCTYI